MFSDGVGVHTHFDRRAHPSPPKFQPLPFPSASLCCPPAQAMHRGPGVSRSLTRSFPSQSQRHIAPVQRCRGSGEARPITSPFSPWIYDAREGCLNDIIKEPSSATDDIFNTNPPRSKGRTRHRPSLLRNRMYLRL